MEEKASTVPATSTPPGTEPRLVHIGDIRLELGETSLGGETPRGSFSLGPDNWRYRPEEPLEAQSAPKLQVADILSLGYFNTVYPLPEGFGIQSTTTEGLRAKIFQGGSDYPLVYKDQLTEININAVAQGLNDPHVFRLTSHGLCEWGPLVSSMMRKEADARSSSFGEINLWQVYRINTDSKDYAWLNFACVIGQEKLVYEEGRLAATSMKLY
ncbi:MAG: hypothetical protein Q9201_006254 [Fulgogasparrea decipioides]